MEIEKHVVKLQKSGLNYKLIESLKPIAEELVKDAEAGIVYWRKHKYQKCYKCHKRGHVAVDCSSICPHCQNKHTSKLCLVAIQNWIANIEKAINTDPIEAKKLQQRIARNANIDFKIKQLQYNLKNKISQYKHKLAIQNQNFSYIMANQVPIAPALSVSQHSLTLSAANPLKMLDEYKNKVADEVAQLHSKMANFSPFVINKVTCKLCKDIMFTLKHDDEFLKDWFIKEGYEHPSPDDDTLSYVQKMVKYHNKIHNGLTISDEQNDQLRDAEQLVAHKKNLEKIQSQIEQYNMTHAKPTVQIVFTPCIPYKVKGPSGRVVIHEDENKYIIPSCVAITEASISKLKKQKQKTPIQSTADKLQRLEVQIREKQKELKQIGEQLKLTHDEYFSRNKLLHDLQSQINAFKRKSLTSQNKNKASTHHHNNNTKVVGNVKTKPSDQTNHSNNNNQLRKAHAYQQASKQPHPNGQPNRGRHSRRK